MFVRKDGILNHVNAVDIQPYIDDGGYEILDDDRNVVTGKKLQAAIDKEIEAHTGHFDSMEQLIEQLNAQGIKINLKED